MTVDTVETATHDNDSYMSQHSKYLRTPVTAAHWQLKNTLIKSASTDSGDNAKLYYTQKNHIKSIDLNSLKGYQHIYDDEDSISDTAVKVDISPSSFDECGGVLAIGGHCIDTHTRSIKRPMGYFAVYFESTGLLERKDTGQMINNCVTIEQAPGSNNNFKIFICNNDRKLYQYDLRGSNLVVNQPLVFDFSLNNCKISPDFRTIVTVGDCSDVFLVHPEEACRKPDKISTLSDSGFSTVFMKDGIQFATCFQSGETYLYDVRNLDSPLHIIHSTRKQTQGSFRNIRSAGPLEDLLFVSEQEGRIHIVDTRDFEKHMVMLMPVSLKTHPVNDHPDIFYYNQPIIKPYRVVKDEIKNFGGEVEKSVNSYRGIAYPYLNNSNSTFNRNSVHSMAGLSLMNLRNHASQHFSNSWLDRNDGLDISSPRVVTHAPSLNMINLDDNYNDDSDDYTGINRPLPTINNGVGDQNVNTNASGSINQIADEQFKPSTWVRLETGKEYHYEAVTTSALFQYNRDNCPVRFASNDTLKHIDYIMDLRRRNYNIRLGWELRTPLNDPFFYVDSTLDILGMEVFTLKGESVLAFASPEGINMWPINKWKRKCYPVYELC